MLAKAQLTRKSLAAAAAIPIAAVVLAGCGGNSTPASSQAAPPAAGADAATIGVANNGSLGKILVDSKGNTVYLFQKDSGTKSACTGSCATIWPPVRATGKPTVSGGLSASKLGTTARSDGAPQVTYAGHPLYLYTADSKPGDATGQGINAFGALWYVLSSSGAAVTSGGAGGSGY
jgi:predicted lipoprotein with Yx(FWY)xxD motif